MDLKFNPEKVIKIKKYFDVNHARELQLNSVGASALSLGLSGITVVLSLFFFIAFFTAAIILFVQKVIVAGVITIILSIVFIIVFFIFKHINKKNKELKQSGAGETYTNWINEMKVL